MLGPMKDNGTFAPWLGVFETLRVIDGVPLFVAEHRAELARAMEALGLKVDFDAEKARAELPSQSGRWRWIVTADGARTLFTAEEILPAEPVALSLSPVRVGSHNWDARFKTLSYLAHAQAAKTGATPEVILLNEEGHVASVSRGNIFWRTGNRLFTPAHEAGCRCGIVRGFVLKHQEVEEDHFPLARLQEADEIFITSSIKGIVSASAMEDRRLVDFTSGDGLRAVYAKAIAAQIQSA
jgi:branched-subunit amino acid aminotransferase/4-amino-4-deoxychorismate lyase